MDEFTSYMHSQTCFQHSCFLMFLLSVEVMVGVGSAVINAWVGGGSELRLQFYKNITVDDEGPNQQAFWDKLQSEVTISNNKQFVSIINKKTSQILQRMMPFCAINWNIRKITGIDMKDKVNDIYIFFIRTNAAAWTAPKTMPSYNEISPRLVAHALTPYEKAVREDIYTLPASPKDHTTWEAARKCCDKRRHSRETFLLQLELFSLYWRLVTLFTKIP